MLPNFVIIGAQKSASTFIQACLSEHSEIYMPSGETAFFESPDYENNSISSLEKLFEGREGKLLGIKRPAYIGKPEVPDRISNVLPNAKLIAVLRNPVERAISAYHHNIKYGFIPPLKIEDGMRMILDGIYNEKYKRSQEIIEFGKYYKYLTEYKKFFEKRNILVLLHEDIVNDKLGAIQKVFSFLGIELHNIPKSLNSTPQEVQYNITRLRLMSWRNHLIYLYNHDRTRLLFKEKNYFGKGLAWLIAAVDKIILARIMDNRRASLSNELADRLFGIYKEDIGKLQTLIGRDLSHWEPRNMSSGLTKYGYCKKW